MSQHVVCHDYRGIPSIYGYRRTLCNKARHQNKDLRMVTMRIATPF